MKLRYPGTHKLERDLLSALPGILPSLTITRATIAEGAGPVIDVRTPSGRAHTLYVESRAASTPSRVPQALRQLKASHPKAAKGYPVLASAFLSPRARELCKEEGVGYLDLAGNCFLQFDDFYLQRIVDKNPFPRRGRPASLFSPISSRLLRALLEEPTRTWQVQELSRDARVSLGQASNVCRRLIDEGYAATADRRFRVTQPAALLDSWRDGTAMRRPAPRGCYSFERDPERLMRRVAEIATARRWRYAVTSFGAASLVAPFVRGVGTVEWYLGEEASVEQWVEALDLRPIEAGPNAVLLLPDDAGVFYRAQTVQGVTLVGNVQLYLDLAREPARGREQAEFLRKETLTF